MANTKSAKKTALQSEVKRTRNLARKTSIKTAIKKIIVALEKQEKMDVLQDMLKDAQAKIARARGKGLLHANNAARKVSRLNKKVAQAAAR